MRRLLIHRETKEYRPPVATVSKRPVLYSAGHHSPLKTPPRPTSARPGPKTKPLVSSSKPAQRPAAIPAARAVKPIPPPEFEPELEPDDEVWISEERHGHDAPSVEPTARGHYELNPTMSRILEAELQHIMIKVWKELPDLPPAGAERLVVECYRNRAGDDLRNTLGLNVTKRLLNIYNTLTVRVNFSRKPEPSQVRAFMKATRCAGLRRVSELSYAAHFGTVADFDKACADKAVACGEVRAHVVPAMYKFTQCPAKVKTIYSDITQNPDEMNNSADSLASEGKDGTIDNKTAEGARKSAGTAAEAKTIPQTNTRNQNDNKTVNVAKAKVIQSPEDNKVSKPTAQPKVIQNQIVAKTSATKAPEEAKGNTIPAQNPAKIEANPKVAQTAEVKKVVAKPTVDPKVTEKLTVTKNSATKASEEAKGKTTPAQNPVKIEAKIKVAQTVEVKKVVAKPTVEPKVTQNQTVSKYSATKLPVEAKGKTIPAQNPAKVEIKPQVAQISEVKKIVVKPTVEPKVTQNQTVAKNNAVKAPNIDNATTKTTPIQNQTTPEVESQSKVVKPPVVKNAEVAKPIAQAKNAPNAAKTPEVGKPQPKVSENQTVAKNTSTKTPNTDSAKTVQKQTTPVPNQTTPKVEAKPKVVKTAQVKKPVAQSEVAELKTAAKPNTTNIEVTKTKAVLGLTTTGKQNQDANKVETKPKGQTPKKTVVAKPTTTVTNPKVVKTVANKNKPIAKKTPKQTNSVYFPLNKMKTFNVDEDISDNDELDDEDILALMSRAIVLDQCSGSDEE